MILKRIVAVSVICITAACSITLFNNCSNKQQKTDDRPLVVVSLNPIRQMIDQLAGDDFRIYTLLPNGENPETYDPTASSRKTVADADMYFTTGYLTFEGNLELGNSSLTKFVNISEGIEPIYGTHGHEHEATVFLTANQDLNVGADPHIWSSIRNAKIMVENMAEGLAQLRPENATIYRQRARVYNAHLDSLDHALATRLDSASTKSFLVWHPSLSYFARDYGLEQIAVGHETKEPSATGLRTIIDHAKADSVKVFLYQESIDSRKAEAIGASIRANMCKLDPLAYDWEGTLTAIANAIAN